MRRSRKSLGVGSRETPICRRPFCGMLSLTAAPGRPNGQRRTAARHANRRGPRRAWEPRKGWQSEKEANTPGHLTTATDISCGSRCSSFLKRWSLDPYFSFLPCVSLVASLVQAFRLGLRFYRRLETVLETMGRETREKGRDKRVRVPIGRRWALPRLANGLRQKRLDSRERLKSSLQRKSRDQTDDLLLWNRDSPAFMAH